MRIVCAYTDLHPLTALALKQYARTVELYELNAAPDAYWTFLEGMWREGQTFLNIEQDNEIHKSVVKQMANCGHLWCVFPYTGPGRTTEGGDPLMYGALGCTKFSSELMERHPDLMQALPVRNWQRLDCHILPALRQLGYEQHIHWPEVKHHHVYQGVCACGGKHGDSDDSHRNVTWA